MLLVAFFFDCRCCLLAVIIMWQNYFSVLKILLVAVGGVRVRIFFATVYLSFPIRIVTAEIAELRY
jgi:predicted transporter